MELNDEEQFLRFALSGVQQDVPAISTATARAFEFLAVDVCARRLYFEQRRFQNQDSRAWELVEQTRRAIATGGRILYVEKVLNAELQLIAASLPAESELRFVFANLCLVLPPVPWVAAKEARSFHLSQLVRYSGPWIDRARSAESRWFSRRLSWWLRASPQLADPLLAYADATAANVPPDASLEHLPSKA